MSKWIDRMATFDPKDSMRSDKVAFYFTADGLLCGSLDGVTTFTVPLSSTTTNTGNATLTPGQSGGTILLSSTGGRVLTLPKASLGTMTFKLLAVADIGGSGVRLVPASTDVFRGAAVTSIPGKYVEVAAANITTNDWITLTSDGGTRWYVSSNITTWGVEALSADEARMAKEQEAAEKAEAEKAEKVQKLLSKEEDEEKGRLVKKPADDDDKRRK